MAQLDLTNIANASVTTPSSGVTSLFAESTQKRLSYKTDVGTVNTITAVVAAAATASVAATQTNLINYTPPATAGRYRLTYTIAHTAGTNTGTVTPTFTYKDAAGIAKSYNIPMRQEGSVTWLLASTAASKNFSGGLDISIDNSATAITATFTVSGTVAVFISAILEQVA